MAMDKTAPPEESCVSLLEGVAGVTRILAAHAITMEDAAKVLDLLREACGADRVCARLFPGGDHAAAPHLDRCVGRAADVAALPVFERWRRRLDAGDAIHGPLEAFPDDERAELAARGVVSVAMIPIAWTSTTCQGYLRFDHLSTSHTWTVPELMAMQVAANAVGAALAYHKAVRTLAQHEARYRRILENTPVMVFRMRLPEGRYEFVSPASEQIVGYTPEEIYAQPLLVRDTLHPGWRGYFEDQWAKLLHGEVPPTYEFAVVHGRTGETRWLHQRNVVIRDDEGEPIAIEGVVSDVTEQVRSQRDLRTREARLSSILRAAPTGIGLVADRIILDVNDRLCRMTGYSRSELIGQSARMLYATQAEFDRVGIVKYGQIRREGTGTLETVWQCKDGALIDVLLNSTPLDPDDATGGITFTALDITERNRALRELQESEARLRVVISASPIVLFASDANGKLSFVTGKGMEALELATRDLLGHGLRHILPDRPDVWAIGDRLMAGEEVAEDIYINGRWLSLFGTRVLTESGEVGGVIGVATDITDRKQAEVRNETSLREKELLLQEIHHRVKNNLAVVSSLLGLQAMQIDDPDLAAALQESQYRINAMASIHEHLYRAPELGSVVMSSYTVELADVLQATYGSPAVSVEVDADDTVLDLDQAMPCSLILNELLTNALQHGFPEGYLPDHGEGHVVIRLRTVDDHCRLAVSDDGVGLPPGFDLASLDSLGLSLIGLLTKQMNGTFEIASERGTTARVRFRLKRGAPPAAGAGA